MPFFHVDNTGHTLLAPQHPGRMKPIVVIQLENLPSNELSLFPVSLDTVYHSCFLGPFIKTDYLLSVEPRLEQCQS